MYLKKLPSQGDFQATSLRSFASIWDFSVLNFHVRDLFVAPRLLGLSDLDLPKPISGLWKPKDQLHRYRAEQGARHRLDLAHEVAAQPVPGAADLRRVEAGLGVWDLRGQAVVFMARIHRRIHFHQSKSRRLAGVTKKIPYLIFLFFCPLGNYVLPDSGH